MRRGPRYSTEFGLIVSIFVSGCPKSGFGVRKWYLRIQSATLFAVPGL